MEPSQELLEGKKHQSEVCSILEIWEKTSSAKLSPLSFPLWEDWNGPSLSSWSLQSLTEEEAGGIQRMPDTAQLPIPANLGARSQIIPVGKKSLQEIKWGKKKDDRDQE